MQNKEPLYSHLDDKVLIITFNRPVQINALTEEVIQKLQEKIQEVYDNSEIQGAILTGQGSEAFVTGTEAKELLKLNERNARKFSENGQEVCALIENCPKPIVAAINGYALDGGCELALACHFRVAIESAVLGFPEISFGMMPGFGGTQRLTSIVGKTKALELFMTGACITSEEAVKVGLINDVVCYKEAMFQKGREWIRKVAVNQPIAVGMLINCVNATSSMEEDGYQTESNCFANCFKIPSVKENLLKLAEQASALLEAEEEKVI